MHRKLKDLQCSFYRHVLRLSVSFEARKAQERLPRGRNIRRYLESFQINYVERGILLPMNVTRLSNVPIMMPADASIEVGKIA